MHVHVPGPPREATRNGVPCVEAQGRRGGCGEADLFKALATSTCIRIHVYLCWMLIVGC